MHKLIAGSDAAQQRSQTRTAEEASLLPVKLPPRLYAMCASTLSAPLSVVPRLPDVLFVIRLSSSPDNGVALQSVQRWRITKMRRLKSCALQLWTDAWANYSRTSEIRRFWNSQTLSTQHDQPSRCTASIGLAWTAPRLSTAGSALLGTMPRRNINRTADVQAELHLCGTGQDRERQDSQTHVKTYIATSS